VKKSNLFISAVAIITLMSCDRKECSKPPLNPNGDSELALLMRSMFDDGMKFKTAVENNKEYKLTFDADKLLTAMATEPEKVQTQEYKAYAQQMINIVNAQKTAGLGQQSEIYQDFVQNCTACHQQLCPGPLVKIERLNLSK